MFKGIRAILLIEWDKIYPLRIIEDPGHVQLKAILQAFLLTIVFEAIVPVGIASNLQIVSDKVSSLNLTDQFSNLKNYAVSTANSGYITIKSVFS